MIKIKINTDIIYCQLFFKDTDNEQKSQEKHFKMAFYNL